MICYHAGTSFSVFVVNIYRCLRKTVEPRFCETLYCFQCLLKDMTLPESIKNQKTKPSEISIILALTKQAQVGFAKILCIILAPFLNTFLNYFRRRFQALKNAKNRNGGCFPGEATQDASQKRGEPGGTQEAPRHPGSSRRSWRQ